MATDMSLGGGAGFGAGYTPIRFAPLVSLTGPVMAPATPAAPEAAAPMIRPPMMVDQSGGYEFPTRTDAAFQNLQPIGTRIQQGGIGPELRDLGRGLSFMTSPLVSTGSLLATGKLPLDYVLGDMGGVAQPRAPAQGTAAAPFGGFLQGLQNFLFGPQRESVSLAGGPSGVNPQASYQNAVNASLSGGATQEMADAAGRAALGLISQGMNPTSAVALASMTALGQVGPQMQEVAPIQTMGSSMLGGNMQAFGGYTQGGWDDPDRPESSRFTGIESMPMDVFGNPYSSMGVAAPSAPQAAQMFALGDSNMGVSSTDFGFDPGGGVGAAPSSAAAGMGPGW